MAHTRIVSVTDVAGFNRINTQELSGIAVLTGLGQSSTIYSSAKLLNMIDSYDDLLAACKAAQISLIGDEHYYAFKPLIKTLESAINKAEGR